MPSVDVNHVITQVTHFSLTFDRFVTEERYVTQGKVELALIVNWIIVFCFRF